MKEAVNGLLKTLHKGTYFKDAKSVLKMRWSWGFLRKTDALIEFPNKLVFVQGIMGLYTGESEEERSKKPLPEFLKSRNSRIMESLPQIISVAAPK